MTTFFQVPLVFKGEESSVVLMFKDHIIGKISQAEADACIANMNNGVMNAGNFDKVINLKEVAEYEFEIDHDSYIMFTIKKEDGSTSIETIDFSDKEETKKAEKEMIEPFKKNGLKREERQLSAAKAAVVPGILTAIVAAIGGLITLFAYKLHNYQPTRTRIMKAHIYMFYKIAKVAGHWPFLIITIFVIAFGLYKMFKRISNPPIKITAAKFN